MRRQINESIGNAVTNVSAQRAAPTIAKRGLFAVLAFLLVTLALYAFGPVTFARHATAQTVALVSVYMTLFAGGYLSLTQRPGVALLTRSRPATSIKMIKAVILIGLIVAFIKLLVDTSLNSLTLNGILNALTLSIQDSGTAYYDSLQDAPASGPLIWGLVLLSPISWSAFALSVAYFDRLGIKFRILVFTLFFAEAARWIVEGKNKGVFDLVIIIAAVLWIKVSQRRFLAPERKRPRRTGMLSRTLFILACSLGALTLFTRAIMSRSNNLDAIYVANPGPFMEFVPNWLQPTLVAVTMYLGQGYHALSYLPQIEWNPTYGVGHSLFLSLRLDQYFGTHIIDRMYQTQLAGYGIHPSVNWHSFYVWMANDVHWLGVIPVMFLLGRFAASVVLRAFLNDSASNYALLALLAIMLVYIPANAQVFQEPTTFMAFWGLILYQVLYRRSHSQGLASSATGPSTRLT